MAERDAENGSVIVLSSDESEDSDTEGEESLKKLRKIREDIAAYYAKKEEEEKQEERKYSPKKWMSLGKRPRYVSSSLEKLAIKIEPEVITVDDDSDDLPESPVAKNLQNSLNKDKKSPEKMSWGKRRSRSNFIKSSSSEKAAIKIEPEVITIDEDSDDWLESPVAKNLQNSLNKDEKTPEKMSSDARRSLSSFIKRDIALLEKENVVSNIPEKSPKVAKPHRHFLDILENQVSDPGAGSALVTTPAPYTYVKCMQLKRKLTEEESSSNDSDFLPDLPNDSNAEAVVVLSTKKEVKIKTEEKPVREPPPLVLVKAETWGREVRRNPNDRWWCCLPPQDHARLVRFNVATRLKPMARTAHRMIEGGLDEAAINPDYYLIVKDLILDYLNQRTEPPKHIVRYLLFDRLPHCRKAEMNVTLSMLHTFLDLYPPHLEICFSFDEMQSALDWLCATPENSSNSCEYTKRVHQFSVMVQTLESELQQHSFAKKNLMRSVAYQTLNVDCNLKRLKGLINSLGVILSKYELDTTVDYFTLHLSNNAIKLEDNNCYRPKLVHLVQRTLILGLVASRRQEEAASMVVNEVYLVYKRLPNLSHRKVLIETLTWPVLRLQLLQRVLEDMCNCSHVPSSFLTLSTIFSFYLEECTPPFEAVTPPSTPSDDGEAMDTSSEEPNTTRSGFYGESSCEELVYLLLQLVQTYITFRKRGHWQTLSQRILNFTVDDLLDKDQYAVPQLLKKLETFEKRLCHVASPRTKVYFLQIRCLLDLFI